MTNYVFEESCTNIVLYIKFYISLDIHVEAILKDTLHESQAFTIMTIYT